MVKKTVLITGGAGRIGGILCRLLGDKFVLSSLDLVRAEGVSSHVADLADLDAIRPAFGDQDVVVHLGGDPHGQAPWDSVLRDNIVGTHNVMEAAREAGVKQSSFRQHKSRRRFLS